MRITSVASNGRQRRFDVVLRGRSYDYPYTRCQPRPSGKDPVADVFVDPELAREAFTFRLRSGAEGSVHAEQVLDHHKDPSYLRDQLVYRLTLAARDAAARSPLGKREMIRRMGTSPAQLYRLLDPANSTKSLDQVLRLLSVLDCDVDLVVRERSA